MKKATDPQIAKSTPSSPENPQEHTTAMPDFPAPAPDYSGNVLGGYQLVRKIAEGGMGVVYEAIQLNLSRKVAVKILNNDLASRPEFVQRFQREAKAAAALSHPNMVQVHDFCQTDGHCCLVMEFVEGQDLGAYADEKGKLPIHEALVIVEQAALALKAACEKAIIHRDIKPSNLMLTKDGTVKVSDLGLAKILTESSDLTLTGMGMGSPYFIAPEQANDARDADHRADIYSLGLTLLFLVTGKRPFDGNTPFSLVLAHATKPLPKGIELGTRLPAEVEGLIQKMAAKIPADRHADYDVLLSDLRRVKAGQAPAFDFAAIKRKVFSLQTALAATAVLAILLGAALFINHSKSSASGKLAVAPAVPVRQRNERPIPDQRPGAGDERFGPPQGLEDGPPPEAGEGQPPGGFSGPPAGQSTIRLPLGPLPRPGPSLLQDGPPEDMLSQADKYAKEHPQNFRDIVDRYRQVLARTRGTPLEQELNQRLSHVVEQHQTAARQALADFELKMDQKLRAQDPQGAYDAWKDFPQNLRTFESDRQIQLILQQRLPPGFVPR